MNWKRLILLLLGAAGVVALVAARWMPNEEKVVRNRLTELANRLSVRSGDSAILRMAGGSLLESYFAKDVVIQIEGKWTDESRIVGRDELVERMRAARVITKEALFKLFDLQVKLTTPESATAYMTVVGDVNGEKNAITQEMRIQFRRSEGAWLITKIESLKTLK